MNNKNKILTPLNCAEGCHRVEVPSSDEVAALDAMRNIKKRVRAIKQDMGNLSSSEKDMAKKVELENEMFRLKAEWEKWEEKREEAAKIRMILLGHEEP